MKEFNPAFIDPPAPSSLNATTQTAAVLFLEHEKELGRDYTYATAFKTFYVRQRVEEKFSLINTEKLKARFVAYLIDMNKMEPVSMTLDDVKTAWEFVKALIINAEICCDRNGGISQNCEK